MPAPLVGFAYATVVICTAVVLSVTVVGLPVLAGALVGARAIGRTERCGRGRRTRRLPRRLQAPAHPAAVDVEHGPSTAGGPALRSGNESAPQSMPDTRSSCPTGCRHRRRRPTHVAARGEATPRGRRTSRRSALCQPCWATRLAGRRSLQWDST
ncbi:sensor domain-containing protein [Streptomyces sp. NBC_00390]|uniref:sensor domain-containing protein n=1 Tax=Streptomyces sp. NBC_00390 TaxID=2975736 RepID=UPI003FCD47E4